MVSCGNEDGQDRARRRKRPLARDGGTVEDRLPGVVLESVREACVGVALGIPDVITSDDREELGVGSTRRICTS